MEFSKSHARFRNWALGQGADAGAWGRDEIRNIYGVVGGVEYFGKVASGAFKIQSVTADTFGSQGMVRHENGAASFDASRVVPTGPLNVPPHIWQPIILYLGRPR